jgi:hypothetical protein
MHILPPLLLTTGIAIVLGVFQEMADPFGLDSYTDRISSDIYATITAPLYGQKTQLQLDGVDYASRAGQAEIIVLLIDDAYLESSGQHWPIAPKKYKRILRKLAGAGTGAVFVDIYFNQNSPDKQAAVADLFNYAARLEQRSTTTMVFAGRLQDPWPEAMGVPAPHAALAQMFSEPNFYALQQTTTDGQIHDTAAWRLYQIWCRQHSARCDQAALTDFPDDDMYLHWGYTPNRMMTEVSDFQAQQCIPQSEHLIDSLLRSARIMAWNLVKGFNDQRIAPCPYHTQLKLPLFNDLSAAELKQLLAGKTVILGTELSLYPDYQLSPLHGYLPGAFWHATALDNLIEFSSNYIKSPEGTASDYSDPVALALMFILQATISYGVQRRAERAALDDHSLDKLRLDLFQGLFTLCLISASVLLVTGYMRWGPANWLGLAALLFMIDIDPIKALPRYCWALRPIRGITWKPLALVFNALRTTVVLTLLLLIGYLLFVLPHALLLAGDHDHRLICAGFILLYTLIGLICLYRLFWRTLPCASS